MTDHDHKKRIVHTHFSAIIKKSSSHPKNINWTMIPSVDCDLSALGAAITEEEEVKSTAFALPSDKAPGGDGFTRNYFK